jgi:hypothetical protein
MARAAENPSSNCGAARIEHDRAAGLHQLKYREPVKILERSFGLKRQIGPSFYGPMAEQIQITEGAEK